ncbi:MAG: radical SAM protein [Epsilonproteobacteria bacterium]|nr:MAG: radical SAM protein [Campylobacterota bacterium]
MKTDKKAVIIDLYSDEPSGLGVPPFIGTYPRYVYGALKLLGYTTYYITIDDIRLWKDYNFKPNRLKKSEKTKKDIINLTINSNVVNKILEKAKLIVVNCGFHTPGKYLTAKPGSLKEIEFIKHYKSNKVLIGPMAYGIGSSYIGGRSSNKEQQLIKEIFDEPNPNFLDIENYNKVAKYAVAGAELISQLRWNYVICEIELGRGCTRPIGCSFCTEPIKHRLEFRLKSDIIKELRALKKEGIKAIRFGKQSDFYSYLITKNKNNHEEIEKLLRSSSKIGFDVIHIDNVDPRSVISEKGIKITKSIVKYCSDGNIASFGVESFDEHVIKLNNLNTTPEITMKAIRIINKYGKNYGKRGLPKFLPGINILLGLIGETKQTLDINFNYLKKILDQGLWIRRINIRQVVGFKGTRYHSLKGWKYIKKNKKYYYRFIRDVRVNIDHQMLMNMFPKGHKIRDVVIEIKEGSKKFGRNIGGYPIIIGVDDKSDQLIIGKRYNVEVVGHELRSLVGRVI